MKILFRAYNFIPHFPVDIIRGFFITEFGVENLKVNKTSEKDHSFYNIALLKKPHSFTNLSSFEIENNMLPKHSQKPFSVYKFYSKHVSVWYQKKHLHCTISWHLRTTFLKHSESKCLYISVYLSNKFLYQRRIKILSGDMGGWGRLNNFLKVAYCLSLVKCFTIFHFNWSFLKFNYFSAFWYFHQ